jgi:hypothetical protein
METFKARVIEALGAGSRAVEMIIADQRSDNLSFIITKMIEADDETFITLSHEVTDKLITAQHARNISGGVLVIFSGTQGPEETNFIGIMKAEIHTAYEKKTDSDTDEIYLSFVKEALLTPTTRLYKTGAFFERANFNPNDTDLNNRWNVFVSDFQISHTDGKAAAQYFYSNFLGFTYPLTSARYTKDFYEHTNIFIQEMDVPTTQKNDLMNALITYLKTDNSPLVSAAEFADNYLEMNFRDGFLNHMRDNGLPSIAFAKDIEHIKNKLNFRKVNFSKDIKISAPSEIFQKFVTIGSDTYIDDAGNAQPCTVVTIKDEIIY